MSLRAWIGSACIMVASLSVAHAQDSTRASCPVVDGLSITLSTDSTTPGRSVTPRGFRLDARNTIDTTWTFDVRERTWTQPYFVASVGLGWSGGGLTTGTTTAPDRSARRSWSTCAGAAVGMRNVTLMLRGAHGVVHLRADLSSLSRLNRTAAPDSAIKPRR
jgi:hypothetical protein